jgi:signal transduction histidine kinase
VVEGQREMTLRIMDDGQGFDPSQVVPVGCRGIVSMRERAQAIDASVAIESDCAHGTTVRLTLPIEREER